MLEHLNHNLIKFETDIYWPADDYIVYMCNKCNCYILQTIKDDGEIVPEEENYFWIYNDGKFRIPNTEKGIKWHFLTLTCEEELIKKLLE